MLHIKNLPDEMVTMIFTFLGFYDRKKVRLVCKRWHRLSFAPSLIQRDALGITACPGLNRRLSQSSCYPNITIDLDSETKRQQIKGFFSKNGAGVRYLKVDLTIRSLELCLYIFTKCPNLQHLIFLYRQNHRCRFPDISLYSFSFPKLLSMTLAGHLIEIDSMINSIAKDSTKLEEINIDSNVYNVCSSRLGDPILNLISNHSATLRVIKLFIDFVKDEFSERLTQITCPKLTTFSVMYLTDRSLRCFSKSFSNLLQIFLYKIKSSCVGFRDVFSSLQHLSVVSIGISDGLTNSNLALIGALRNLSHLRLFECPQISDEGVGSIFGSSIRPRMVDLQLKDLDITDDVICKIAPNLPNLRVLHLTSCWRLTNLSLARIFLHNTNLRCLSLTGCPQINDLSVGLSVNNLKNLIHLSLDCWEDSMASNPTAFRLSLPFLECFYQKVDSLSEERTLSLVIECPLMYYLNRFDERGTIGAMLRTRKEESFFSFCDTPLLECVAYLYAKSER